MEYVDRKENPLIQEVRTHQHNTDSAVLQTARCLKAEVQRETKIKESLAEKTKERWYGKRMHGQLPRNLDEKLVDIEQSYRWVKSGDIKGETEGNEKLKETFGSCTRKTLNRFTTKDSYTWDITHNTESTAV